jgi:DNA replication and repair protein RecF
VQTVSDYNKVIKQKNKLLQVANESEFSLEKVADLVAPWNDQLVRLAASIHHEREAYVAGINTQLERQFFDRRDLTTRYVSALEGKGDLSDYEVVLRERINLRQAAELASGHSLIGPHRDDLEILLDGREIRVYGSSGQQRSALLLLDLAAISLYNLASNDQPVFVIDDVDAELDERRIRRLLEYLENRTRLSSRPQNGATSKTSFPGRMCMKSETDKC